MKIATSFLGGVLLIGPVAAMAADGVLLKEEIAPGTSCHMKFPAIEPRTLGSDHPTLKSSTTGDIIDFYGPCDESPTGQSQVWQQRNDRHFWQNAR